MRPLKLPLDEGTVRSLRAGDEVSLSGVIVTARDAAHKLMVEEKPAWLSELLDGTVIYHCGPVMRRTKAGWEAVSAGPTTSIREEPYQAAVIGHYRVRGVMGKGGMGKRTLEACREHGAVYLHAVGGAAVSAAQRVRRVVGVKLLEELGSPEAFWLFEVEGFPALVTMDSTGHSLHDDVLGLSTKRFAELR